MAYRRHAGDDSTGVEDICTVKSPQKQAPFHTLCVMEISSLVPQETTDWLLRKVQDSRDDGGAELLAQVVDSTQRKGTVVHISAECERLLLAAELMELKKPYKDGSLREITLDDLDNFQGTEDLDSFLHESEKQRITLHELEQIRALEEDKNIAGYPKLKLYKGKAIVAKCLREHIIEQIYPLHDREQLKTLGHTWFKQIAKAQPLDDVRKYFGETVAMYFAFLGFYTMALIPPAAAGVLCSIASFDTVSVRLFFAIFNLVWATVFLEVWKRHCSTLAYHWGTIRSEKFEEARAAYHGELGINKVTGRLEPKYPKWKRLVKFYCVSLPVVIFCLQVAFVVMLVYFWWEQKAIAYYNRNNNIGGLILVNVPSAVYAVVIILMNAVYRKLARALNDWENHRLQSAYDNHLITKLVLFEFINCFMSLFYIAFIYQDMKMLRTTLGTLLIVQQVINQLQESVIPYIMYKRRKKKITKKFESEAETDGSKPIKVKHKVPEEEKLQADIEATKSEFAGTLDDYLEMFIQFGYVFLFSAVFPSAAFWALLNNVTEIRSDAFKLCRIFQRPFAQPTANIKAWQVAFEAISIMAVLTNCALVFYAPRLQPFLEDYGEVKMIVIFVLAEHVILVMKFILSKVIPDEPGWVRTALARVEYESKQAWRKQKIHDAQLLLNQQKEQYVEQLPQKEADA